MALDRTVGKRWAAGLASAVFVLAAAGACSRADSTVGPAASPEKQLAERPADIVQGEFATFEATGSGLADILAAIHLGEPEIYDKLLKIAASPSWTGTPADALRIGRPLYLSAFRGKLSGAPDRDVAELIDILIATHKALLAPAPLLCALGEKADPAEVGKYAPADLLTRENRLQARVLRLTSPSAPRATQAEIEDWKAKTFKGDEPRLKGNVYFEITDPTPDQASKICDSEMFILERMQKENQERRAYLYRGLMSPR